MGGADTKAPLVLRGDLDRTSLRLSVVDLPSPRPPPRLAGAAPGRPAGQRHRLRPHGAGGGGDGGVPAVTGARGGRLHRPDGGRRAAGGRGGPARRPGGGARGHLGAGDGLRQAGSRLRRAPGRTRLADHLLPAGRARGPGRGARGGGAAAGPGGRGRVAVLRLRRLPAGAAGARDARRPGGRRPSAVHPPRWRRAWTCAARGWSRCSRCSTWTARSGGVRGGWEVTGQDWAYDAERYARLEQARAAEQQAVRDYVTTDGCRMLFLRRQLDDPAAAAPGAEPCGRCDRCTGAGPSTVVAADVLDAAQAHLGRPGVDVDPRRMWPTGMASARGGPRREDPARAAGRARPRPVPPLGRRLGAAPARAAGRARTGPAGAVRRRHRRGPRAGGLGLGGAARRRGGGPLATSPPAGPEPRHPGVRARPDAPARAAGADP